MSDKFIINPTCIDSIEQLDLESLTFEDIRSHYGTGRSLVTVRAYEKKYSYRSGIATNIGDIEVSIWREVALMLIKRAGELELFYKLKEYEKQMRFKTDTELEQHALELHVARIFDNPEWVDYVPFNRLYRPFILSEQ